MASGALRSNAFKEQLSIAFPTLLRNNFQNAVLAHAGKTIPKLKELYMNPLNSILGTLVSGFILTFILIVVIKLIAHA